MDTDTAPCQAQIALAIDDRCDDPIGALENVLGIVRRTGLVLQRMTMRRGTGHGASLLLDLQAADLAPLRLLLARLDNLFDVTATACTATPPLDDAAASDDAHADARLIEALAA
ncbi:hypothetical protein [Chitinasiproducens palmae]|uniref:ACT domain-containing protein n=1 Tax=Chitinasiproducens palmae TaxID=1770053 RepID=A0A1H2PVB4_9BURK|nr:hypothetical protein [Chitinasiproducens palmae]SDV51215.1 hypothetical protein SAMN05216551_115120 [Chitinasiproducens palmae]